MTTSPLPADTLTERERDILRLLAEGNSDGEIARVLVLALSTIKWYNRQIYEKLGVQSRTQAIARAKQVGLLNAAPADAHGPAPHNLPAQTTGLVGRHREIVEVQRVLSEARLVTLSGSPGTGKTRLALSVAGGLVDDFRDGVYFVSLAPLTEPNQIARAVAAVLDVIEITSEPLTETLKRHLARRQVLLLLDNFEHLLPGGLLVADLLAAAPELKALVTSREVLHLRGEYEYSVPPLDLPDLAAGLSAASLRQNEAVLLFIQRAQAANATFDFGEENAGEVAGICVRLDGLPLAIELAAARAKLLTPKQLLERLNNRLGTLTGGPRDLPARQRTLRETIDWSYNLLDPAERDLFARLAVFAGGCGLEAAEAVCGGGEPPVLDGLASLVDKGLVRQTVDASGEVRFAMLETIREYALERLEKVGAAEALRRRYAEYYITFAERAEPGLYTVYRSSWLTRLETEQSNFRAVLGWSLAGDPEPGLRLITSLGVCWRVRSYMVEGFTWAQRLLERSAGQSPALRARALSSGGCLLGCFVGNYADADRMSREALDLAQASGDRPALAGALYARAAALSALDPRAGFPYAAEALGLFRDLDDRWNWARALNLSGELARITNDYAAAGGYYREALALYRQLGNPWGVNDVLQNLAYIAEFEGDYRRAAGLFAEALTVSRDMDDKFTIAACLAGLAGVAGAFKDARRAVRLFGAAEALREQIGAHIPAGDQADYDRNLALAEAQLDAAGFHAAWNEGRALPLARAIAAADEVSRAAGAG